MPKALPAPSEWTTTHALAEQARRLTHAALDLLFPPRCVACRRPGSWLCDTCVAAFPCLSNPLCEVCALPISEPGLCKDCQINRPTFSHLWSAFVYEGQVRQAILAMKYQDRRELAGPLVAAFLDAEAGSAFPLPDGAVLVPVPLHASRMAHRGYNHAALLAHDLARRWKLRIFPPDSLRRIRATTPQADLNRESRLSNVRGAFSARRETVEGHTIILVDDICTTGATLRACSEELLAAGAVDVYAITLSRAVWPAADERQIN